MAARFHSDPMPVGIVHLMRQFGVVPAGADLVQQGLHLPVPVKGWAKMQRLPREQIQAWTRPHAL
ncbi:hypothetical protein, partial [Xanthomonas oryzae]